MNILDDFEEYSKLISVGDGKLSQFNSDLEKLRESHNKLKESFESHKNDVELKFLDSELKSKEQSNLCVSKNEDVSKELNDLKEYRQNMEDYKKVTNDRIEKLVKLFLSINK